MAHRQHRPNISTTNRKTIDIEAMPIPIRFALGGGSPMLLKRIVTTKYHYNG
jgi:hypothetical protein